jgi:hypothetical protein
MGMGPRHFRAAPTAFPEWRPLHGIDRWRSWRDPRLRRCEKIAGHYAVGTRIDLTERFPDIVSVARRGPV